MTTKVQLYGRVNGVSRIGDLLRQYAFPWLAFYIATGSEGDRICFITFASLIQAVPSLALSHYAAKFVRHFSPRKASILANAGMGALSLTTALAVAGGSDSKFFVLLMWGLLGFMEVIYYPSKDCLYAVLAAGNDEARKQANSESAFIYQAGRMAMSLAMIGTIQLIGPIGEQMPRAAIATALLFDAVTFAAVVAFLLWIKDGSERLQLREGTGQAKISILEAAKVRGAVPIFLCVLMLWAFAYSSFYFTFGFYKEFKGVGEMERQISFYVVMLTSAFGGFWAAKNWKLTFDHLVLGVVSACIVEALFALVPSNYLWGTVWLAVNSAVSIFVFTTVFDCIIPQLVQGLDKNAEVSASLNLVKEGLSPFITMGLGILASRTNAPRQVLAGACAFALLVVVVTLITHKASIQAVIQLSKSDSKS